MNIQEVDVEAHKQENAQVYLKSSTGTIRQQAAAHHSIIAITLAGKEDGLLLDSTSMQYLHAPRTVLFSDYLRSRIVSSYWAARALGQHLNDHHGELKGSFGFRQQESALMLEVPLRVLNNLVFNKVALFGGRQALFNLRHNEFWKVALEIEGAAYKTLKELRSEMTEELCGQQPVQALHRIAARSNGTGHLAMTTALDLLRKRW